VTAARRRERGFFMARFLFRKKYEGNAPAAEAIPEKQFSG
jgi:hypothetical protein